MNIPFNRPSIVGRELQYITEALENGHLAGDGALTKRCNEWLQGQTGALRALLTHSCTAALEMSAILADVGTGDEVIMPSYTFVSTANAFVLRGAVPVFVDIREDTLNLDEKLVEAAITPKTKAIVAVHYAGVACDMDALQRIADAHGLLLIEDAAQGMMASYKGRALGSIGHLGAISFHETKNLISGEGGALLINDARYVERAEIIREKGTNRSKFFRGQVDKYTWVDIGSSYLPSELISAFLLAQMENAEKLTADRLRMWDRYDERFADLEQTGAVRRPVIPPDVQHNGHMYYLLTASAAQRTALLAAMRAAGFGVLFHYIPLHSSPAGVRYGRAHGDLARTNDLADRLVRLPLWHGLSDSDIDRVVEAVYQHVEGRSAKAAQ